MTFQMYRINVGTLSCGPVPSDIPGIDTSSMQFKEETKTWQTLR